MPHLTVASSKARKSITTTAPHSPRLTLVWTRRTPSNLGPRGSDIFCDILRSHRFFPPSTHTHTHTQIVYVLSRRPSISEPTASSHLRSTPRKKSVVRTNTNNKRSKSVVKVRSHRDHVCQLGEVWGVEELTGEAVFFSFLLTHGLADIGTRARIERPIYSLGDRKEYIII